MGLLNFEVKKMLIIFRYSSRRRGASEVRALRGSKCGFFGWAVRRRSPASQDKKSLDAGANLFVGNLDPDVDEKLLYDTFSAFGVIVTNPKIMRDPETGNSRGFGFFSYDSFETSDAAIEAMNGQYLCNRQITVSYAYKKDTKGERHGTPAERVLAVQATQVPRRTSRTPYLPADLLPYPTVLLHPTVQWGHRYLLAHLSTSQCQRVKCRHQPGLYLLPKPVNSLRRCIWAAL